MDRRYLRRSGRPPDAQNLPRHGARLALILLLPAILLAAGSGGDAGDLFGELEKVRRLAAKEYGVLDSDITLGIENDQSLAVSIRNFPITALSDENREAKAREVASFLKRNIQTKTNLKEIIVRFILEKTYFLIIRYTYEGSYSFRIHDLGSG